MVQNINVFDVIELNNDERATVLKISGDNYKVEIVGKNERVTIIKKNNIKNIIFSKKQNFISKELFEETKERLSKKKI